MRHSAKFLLVIPLFAVACAEGSTGDVDGVPGVVDSGDDAASQEDADVDGSLDDTSLAPDGGTETSATSDAADTSVGEVASDASFEVSAVAADAADSKTDVGADAVDANTPGVDSTPQDIGADVPADAATTCARDADCASGVCLYLQGGTRACARACAISANCPTGFRCGQVTGGTSVCWPRFDALCKPCSADTDCRYTHDGKSTGDLSACVKNVTAVGSAILENGSFCAAMCDATLACPSADYYCQNVDNSAVKQCVKADKICDCRTQFAGAETSCSLQTSYGKCLGKRRCSDTGAPTACDARTATVEVCNGVDDNCDGSTDEGGPALCGDDGINCTTTVCGGVSGCSNPVTAGSCRIGSTCYATGASNPSSACEKCDPTKSQTAWSPIANACVIDGLCYNSGQANPSSTCEVCDPNVSSSTWTVVGDMCVINGVCRASGTQNPAVSCEVCDPTKSKIGWSAKPNTCSVSGVCYTAGQSAGQSCRTCDPTKSTTAFSITAGSCFINGTCHTNGQANGGNTCQKCLPCDASPTPSGAQCSTTTLQAQSKTAFTSVPNGTTCASADTCFNAATCSAGVCPARTYIPDSNESNNTISTSTFVGNGQDCDGSGVSGKGTLSGNSDADWFGAYFSDESFCSVDPVITTATSNATMEFCVYYFCSGVTVSCNSGATSSTQEGWVGCCKSGVNPTFSATPNCSGGNDSASVRVAARNLVSSSSCASYTWSMHF